MSGSRRRQVHPRLRLALPHPQMARRLPTALLLASALLATAAAGCGGSDTGQVSAEELVSRADQICSEGRERFEEVQAESPSSASAAAEQTGELAQIAGDELDELREIRPPDELSEPYDDYLEARERALELLEQGRDAAEDKDADAYEAAQAKAAAEQDERLKLARAVGFEQCSKR
jgi:ElaB/YqjD/DUF883 family membrane-anchored ribosome-binding protein